MKFYFPPPWCLLQKSQVNSKHKSSSDIFSIYFKHICLHAYVLPHLLIASHRNIDACRVTLYLVLSEMMLINIKLLLAHCL